MFDKLGKRGKLVAALANLVAAVGTVLYFDVLEGLGAPDRERVAVHRALRGPYEEAAVLAELSQEPLRLYPVYVAVVPSFCIFKFC